MADQNSSLLEKLEALDQRCVEIDRQISDPAVASDPNKLIPLTKEQGKLMGIVGKYRKYRSVTNQLEEARGICADPDAAGHRARFGQCRPAQTEGSRESPPRNYQSSFEAR